MAYVCENCGELTEDNKICDCVLTIKKDKLKQRTKKYYLKKKIDNNIANQILKTRNIDIDYKDFIEVDFNKIYEDKFLNQEEAIKIIMAAIKNKTKIAIYGDYDADGITGTAVGLNILRALGADTTYYINDRFTEGFGINPTGVIALHKEKVGLIITVDNGISGIEGVEKAKELGIEVIITDHHEPNSNKLPDCLIIDPKQPGCPSINKEITGVGVLYKILLDICKIMDKELIAKKEMDLVALGTVADMALLLDENRLIVKTGLMIWNHPKGKYGIKRLIEKTGIKKEITSYELGFILAPILNAESRLKGRPVKGITLLTSSDKNEIDKAIDELIEINNKRKEMLEQQIKIGESLIDPDKYLFFIFDNRITEGIAGLIASRIMDTYKRPTIVLGKTHEGYYKGSGRSIKEFNLKKALDKNNKLLKNYGGHQLACGLTIENDNLDLVKNLLETEGKIQLEKKESIENIYIDAKVTAKELNMELMDCLNQLEPFGNGFNKPLFLIEDINLNNILYMKDIHSKFTSDGIEFIAFNKLLEKGNKSSFIGIPQINSYNGRQSIQFIIKEILEEGTIICELEK
ncbi:MAG: single-stranded-DNA-specific exonuclease RecJ [Firmicutes bacterium]|nr:single-stranded-DNA-specific exonuclease RecJ [Bacillota bacterium]